MSARCATCGHTRSSHRNNAHACWEKNCLCSSYTTHTPTPPARGDVTLESLAREAAEKLKRCAVWEDFDCPGDTPVSCGLWCSLCEQHVNDQQTDHASHCLITRLCGENKDTGNG